MKLFLEYKLIKYHTTNTSIYVDLILYFFIFITTFKENMYPNINMYFIINILIWELY